MFVLWRGDCRRVRILYFSMFKNGIENLAPGRGYGIYNYEMIILVWAADIYFFTRGNKLQKIMLESF